jgi:hypothetical protein
MRFRLGPAKPRFAWCLWHWTSATENLFTLSREDLFVFTLLVDEANKTPTVQPTAEPKRWVAVVRKPNDYSYLDNTY